MAGTNCTANCTTMLAQEESQCCQCCHDESTSGTPLPACAGHHSYNSTPWTCCPHPSSPAAANSQGLEQPQALGLSQPLMVQAPAVRHCLVWQSHLSFCIDWWPDTRRPALDFTALRWGCSPSFASREVCLAPELTAALRWRCRAEMCRAKAPVIAPIVHLINNPACSMLAPVLSTDVRCAGGSAVARP